MNPTLILVAALLIAPNSLPGMLEPETGAGLAADRSTIHGEHAAQGKPVAKRLQEVVVSFGLKDKVFIRETKAAAGLGVAAFSTRMDFPLKEGYRFDDLLRLLSKIQRAVPEGRVLVMEFGSNDPVDDVKQLYWRTQVIEVVTPADAGWAGKAPGRIDVAALRGFWQTFEVMRRGVSGFNFMELTARATSVHMKFAMPGVEQLGFWLDRMKALPRFEAFCLGEIRTGGAALGEGSVVVQGRMLLE